MTKQDIYDLFSNLIVKQETEIPQKPGFQKAIRNQEFWGWSGGAMVMGKLPVPGRPTGLNNSSARAYLACSR